MRKITQNEAFMLRKHRLQNYVHVFNRTHNSKQKTYYAVETPKVLAILDKKDNDA